MAVIVSLVPAATVGVTLVVNRPPASVMPLAGETVLPFLDATLMATFCTGDLAESVRVKVMFEATPVVMELLPLALSVVPVTSTPFFPTAESAAALMAIVRTDLSLPRFSFAVTNPFASDTPPVLKSEKYAVGSLPLENVTVLPEIA